MPGSDPKAPTLLILGGTGEAVRLAEALAGRLRVVSSLAGVTVNPRLPPGEVRIGPFGGAAGLAAYLRAEGVAAVIDATHPFAAGIARNARLACEAAGVARLKLVRPPWRPQAGDRWIEAADAAAAARLLPSLGSRAFLTIGGKGLAAFAGVAGVWFLVRLPQAPAVPPPLPECHVVTAGDDRDLMSRHAIDVLVTKASGGPATAGKIDAARSLGLPVLMLRRPRPEPGETAGSVAQALAWVEAISPNK